MNSSFLTVEKFSIESFSKTPFKSQSISGNHQNSDLYQFKAKTKFKKSTKKLKILKSTFLQNNSQEHLNYVNDFEKGGITPNIINDSDNIFIQLNNSKATDFHNDQMTPDPNYEVQMNNSKNTIGLFDSGSNNSVDFNRTTLTNVTASNEFLKS